MKIFKKRKKGNLEVKGGDGKEAWKKKKKGREHVAERGEGEVNKE